MKNEFLDYVEDIIEAMNDASAFVENFDFEDFIKDRKTIYAVNRALEIIGEAVIGGETSYGWNDPMPTHTPNNPNTQYGGYNNGYLGVALGFTGAGVGSLYGAGKCYIGFLDHSPRLKDIHNGQDGMTNWGVSTPIANFAKYFYQHLSGYDDYGAHPSIADSLNYV